MTHVYVIEGRPRSGKNSTKQVYSFRRRRRITVKSDAATAWQAEALRQLAEQRLRTRDSTLTGPVYVEYTAYQSADVADIDNLESALFDAIKKAKLIEDDRLIVDHRGRKLIDAKRPRIEFFVQPAT